MMKGIRTREWIGAALMLLLGIGIAGGGVSYRMGTLDRMGPGFFSVMVGVGLIITSAFLLAAARLIPSQEEDEASAPPQYRPWLFVVASMLAFMYLSRWGMVPATFALVLLSALGDSDNSIKASLLLAAGMTVVAVVVFSMLLGMTSFPALRWN